jgi:hypothetical protein
MNALLQKLFVFWNEHAVALARPHFGDRAAPAPKESESDDRRRIVAGSLSDEKVRAIQSATMDPRHAHLDALMKE